MVTKVSARRNRDGTYATFYAGRKLLDPLGPRAALEWVSEQTRRPDHELSRHSDLTGADIAAFRAGLVTVIAGQPWRVNPE